MELVQDFKHWLLKPDSSGILWLYFDKSNESVNTIDRDVMNEFDNILDLINEDAGYQGVVIASAKPTGFIAGADIEQFTQFKDIQESVAVLELGQGILDKLEKLKIPTVALIDGFCLGGGLELVLACRYRIASTEDKTRLGLPEVRLGIHPGWGGTVRLPKMIGAISGLDLILSGRTVSASAAAKMGFVDAAVPKRQLVNAAEYYIRNKPARHKATFLQSLTNQKLSRQILAQYMRKKLNEKINPSHYPAPFHALDNWELVGVEGKAPYTREAKSCGKLFFSDTCQNLVRVFFLKEKLKNLAKKIDYSPRHVHVIGAGTMGGDIAAWCALRGLTVTLEDLKLEQIAPAIKRAHKLYQEKLKKPHLVQAAMDRLTPDLSGNGLTRADIIIEAVVEDLSIKQKVFKKIESKAKPTAILATNTSSILLDEINTVLELPQRLVGIHFFNPVSKMELVEVVKGKKTSDEVFNKAMVFVRKIDRLPLPVESSPGFLVNRILMPYLMKSMELLNKGIPKTKIDKAMLDFGMPMGPITLADTVGLDVCLSVAKYLGEHYQMPVPDKLVEMVEKGDLGKKSGKGFYKYDKHGKQIKLDNESSDKALQDISDELVLTMLNESFACLREGVVENDDLLDAGMIFGTGFAPFRGGPIHYAKTQGIEELYQQYVKQNEARGEAQKVANWAETI